VLCDRFGDREQTQANRSFWPRTQRPGYNDPVHAVAASIQRCGRAPMGCSFIDAFHTLSSRRVRGLMFWEAINMAHTRGSGFTPSQREQRRCVSKALLYFLAIPHNYEELVRDRKLTIAPIESIAHWPTELMEPAHLIDEQIAMRLASMGVKVETVADAFDFLQGYVMALIANPSEGWDIPELDIVKTAIEDSISRRPHPAGRIEEYGEFVIHPPGLPWPDKELNAAQEKGVSMKRVPIMPKNSGDAPTTVSLADGEQPVRVRMERDHDRFGKQRSGDGGRRDRQPAPSAGYSQHQAKRASNNSSTRTTPLPQSAVQQQQPVYYNTAVPMSTFPAHPFVPPTSQPLSWWPNQYPYPNTPMHPSASAVQQQYNTATLF
ncbi:hypothetical protein R3P38DRAFT_2404845, partial [Favolaschia claudopus]